MTTPTNLLAQLEGLNEQQLRRLLVEHLSKQKLGLYWESSAIERDAALNANLVLPRLKPEWSCHPGSMKPDTPHRNLIIEGDNFDALRLLRSTHAGRIRVIYIDPPYNTGNKDWVYNDRYVGANDRWRHSLWLEFLYRRLTLARDLLTPDGVILVSINDENRARLELLMDEVFPGRRIGSLAWKKRRASNAAGVENFFSIDHEHVLVYGEAGFEFGGSRKNWDKYDQWDEEAKDWWTSTQLTLGFNREQRRNLFYPLHNPKTNIWYPCNPNRVWARASAAILKGREVRTEPMEDLIARNGVHFPEEKSPAIYKTLDELKEAIRNETAPRHLAEQDDFEFWLNKPIGFGKPRFKTYKTKVRTESQPLSSWIVEAGKEGAEANESVELSSGLTSEGTKVLRDLDMGGDFPYPKPLSLLKGLLAQATRPDDIVLDFFAGSGTTGQAVLELNAEDGGHRRFILCSSTESTEKEPQKNLCRDVCAERLRRVIFGHNSKQGYSLDQGGEFAYLQLDMVAPADAAFESDLAHTFQWLSLKRFGTVQPPLSKHGVMRLGRVDDCEVLVCGKVDAAVIRELAKHLAESKAARLAVYCPRPLTVQEQLAKLGIQANAYGLIETLLHAQSGSGA